MINFARICQLQRLEVEYWHKVKTIAFDTAFDNREMSDKEMREGIALAVTTNRTADNFVKDYWTEYWDIVDFIKECKTEMETPGVYF